MKLRNSEYIPTHLTSRIDNTALLYLIAFISPIIGLIESIIQFRKPYAKNLFWIFCIFYGMIHIYMPETATPNDGGADSIRYAENLKWMHEIGISWEGLAYSFYNSEGGNVDLYIPITTFIISIFTDNAHVLFMIFALVFGYFYSRNIWFIIERIHIRLDFTLIILIISFALITPIWQINGVRMWTAIHIFLYGILPFLFNSNPKQLLWCFASPFVHFSFIAPVIILIIYIIIPKKTIPLFILFIISLTIQELDLAVIRENLQSLGFSAFDTRVELYTRESAVENRDLGFEQLSIYVKLARNLSKYLYYSLLIICFLSLLKNKHNHINNYLCFTCLFYSFANIAACVPSGGRFTVLAQMLTAILATSAYIINKSILTEKAVQICALLLLYPIIFSIRTGMDYWGINLLVTNPITCWLITDNTPIISLLK